MSRSKQLNSDAILASQLAFVEKFGATRRFYPDSSIWNFDQSPFNYEFTADRTLSWAGERDTIVAVDQPNKVTHSYTIQPIISRAGRPVGKLLICLQERGGAFGPRVQNEVTRLERAYGNIMVFSSSSGKMSVPLMHDWVRLLVLPSTLELSTTVEETDDEHSRQSAPNTTSNPSEPVAGTSGLNLRRPRVLLLGDSWAGNTNQQVVGRLADQGIEFMQIPQGTTSEIQPLDVQFLRQYKYFVKRIIMFLNLENRTEVATSREGVLNLHSLVWNQFSALAYSDLLRYAWRHVDPDFSQHELTVSGRPQMTQNLQFSFHPGTRCEHGNCTDHAFVQCAHCGKLLCLHHFLERVCFHEVHEQELDQVDLTIQGERPFQALDEEEEAFDESFALFSQDPLQNQSSSSTSSSTVNSLIYRAPFRLSESHKRTN